MGCKFYVGDKVFDKEGLQAYLLENHFEQLADMLRVDKGLSDMQYSMLEEGDFDENGNIRKEVMAEIRAERDKIVSEAKANGTFMKAPNGKPTKLNKEQWVSVRTQRFKDWFGDWEKQTRINKLRHSEPIINDYNGQYELNRESAKAWAKENLRGLYVNKDTKEKIEISRVGIDKVTSHGMGEVQHLKSLVSIPHLIENTIFIEERNNEKNNGKYDSYRYYVAGIKIDGEDYTAKVVIGKKGDSKYYDHELTQIEKGNLISNLNLLAKQVAENQKTFSEKSFTTAGDAPLQPYSLSEIKDTKLISILQNNSSKIVDENGEPLVVYHGDRKKEKYHYGWNTFFTDNKKYAGNYKGESGDVYENFQKNTMQRAELLINGKMKKGA
ncbi:MAG: hypothetical protein Q4B43_01880 [Bacteroidota bacterium]|nr:hypothetical protein [Bacteroidota bacterium]